MSFFVGQTHCIIYFEGTDQDVENHFLRKRSILPVDYESMMKSIGQRRANASAAVKNRDSRIYGENSGTGSGRQCERQVVDAGTDTEAEDPVSERGTPIRGTSDTGLSGKSDFFLP